MSRHLSSNRAQERVVEGAEPGRSTPAPAGSDPAPSATAPWPAFRRNFTLGVLNGILFIAANNLVSPTLVLPGLVRWLGGGNVLVGLLPALDQGGWLLPQLLVGARIQGWRDKLPAYRSSALLRGILFGLLLTVVALAGRMRAGLVLTVFLALYALYTLSAGLAGVPFQEVVAKAIPPQRRGTFFGLRYIGGGLLSLFVVSPLVGVVLAENSRWRFPHNYLLLFALAYGGVLLGLVTFSLVREPPSGELGPAGSLIAQLRLLPSLWRANPTLRRFLLFRLLSRLALIAEPFYVVYAVEELGGPPQVIGGYLAAINGVQIVSYLGWGWLSDRRGNRLLLRLGMGLVVAAPLLALLLPALGGRWGLAVQHSAALFGGVFVLSSLGNTVLGMGSLNYLLEALPERDRPSSLGLVNTIVGLAGMLVIFGGGLADLVGYAALFLLAAGLGLGGILLSWLLPEPRQGRPG